MYVQTNDTLTVTPDVLAMLRSADGLRVQGSFSPGDASPYGALYVRKSVEIPGFGTQSAEKSLSLPTAVMVDGPADTEYAAQFDGDVPVGVFAFLRDSLWEGDEIKLGFRHGGNGDNSVALTIFRTIKTRGRGASKLNGYTFILACGQNIGNAVMMESQLEAKAAKSRKTEAVAK